MKTFFYRRRNFFEKFDINKFFAEFCSISFEKQDVLDRAFELHEDVIEIFEIAKKFQKQETFLSLFFNNQLN